MRNRAPTPWVHLYRYHSDDCIVHTLGLATKAKKLFKDCDCPIWITGTADDGTYYSRTTTGHRDWAAAEAELRSMQAHGKDITVHGPTIEDCATRFLDGHEEKVGDKAKGHHKLTLDRLQAYCKSRGVYHMSGLTYDLLEDFKTYGLKIHRTKARSRVTSST
jgi:hypothetical protein